MNTEHIRQLADLYEAIGNDERVYRVLREAADTIDGLRNRWHITRDFCGILMAERDDARKWARHFYREIDRIRELTARTYCVYCGEEFMLDGTAAGRVREHVMTCEKHPMRRVEHLLKTTQEALYASNKHITQLEREIIELRGDK